MAQLVIHNIEEAVVRRLRARAARNGVSMEEEHRRILHEALLGDKKRGAAFVDYLVSIPRAPQGEPTNLFARKRDMPRKIDL
jgi:plasmid stability protein